MISRISPRKPLAIYACFAAMLLVPLNARSGSPVFIPPAGISQPNAPQLRTSAQGQPSPREQPIDLRAQLQHLPQPTPQQPSQQYSQQLQAAPQGSSPAPGQAYPPQQPVPQPGQPDLQQPQQPSQQYPQQFQATPQGSSPAPGQAYPPQQQIPSSTPGFPGSPQGILGQSPQTSPLQQAPGQGMPQFQGSPSGAFPQQFPGQAAPVSPVQPVPATAAGPCTTKTSADRSTIQLVDSAGQNRSHLSLGRDRVQKTFSSPDGAWEIVVYKVRGEPAFGAIAIDLRGCRAAESVELPGLPENVTFSGGEATLLCPDGATRRVALTGKVR